MAATGISRRSSKWRGGCARRCSSISRKRRRRSTSRRNRFDLGFPETKELSRCFGGSSGYVSKRFAQTFSDCLQGVSQKGGLVSAVLGSVRHRSRDEEGRVG